MSKNLSGLWVKGLNLYILYMEYSFEYLYGRTYKAQL